MIADGSRFKDLRQYFYDNIVNPGMTAISRSLEYGESIGEFKSGSAKILPQVFAGPAIMSAIWHILFNDYRPLDIDALFDNQFRLIETGLIN